MKETIYSFLDNHKAEFTALSDRIHDYAELSGEEARSRDALCDMLEAAGFTVERGLGSQPTAFRARWGDGGTSVGFLAEYDALPGLWQPAAPCYCGDKNRPGHGCGHNLLGTGSVAAAIALKHCLEQNMAAGRIIVYGTPAEETGVGKATLIREGYISDLDFAFSWHPGWRNFCGEYSYMAMSCVEFAFTGVAAHVASYPHEGRSAMDACELTNVGVNYLREHVPPDTRMHYGYRNLTVISNIVPDHATLLYNVRAQKQKTELDVLRRVMKIAEGAALMTETQLTATVTSQCSSTLINSTLARCAYSNMSALPALEYDEKELSFARQLHDGCGLDSVTGRLRTTIEPPNGIEKPRLGSSDFSDVSRILPSLEICTACYVEGTPAHHWTVTAVSRTSIAHKGMLYAAKTLAATAFDVLTCEKLREEARKEFRRRLAEEE